MNSLDRQKTYWDSVAAKKAFTHPIPWQAFGKYVPPDSQILDYGCGYGRSCAELMKKGYSNVIGTDFSSEMIRRGRSMYPELNLQHIDNSTLPFPDHSFFACTLLAVLTCIPTDAGQQEMIKDLYRILKPGGIFLLSDYIIQEDDRNLKRYRKFAEIYKNYGVFELPEGAVVRHHEKKWIHELLASFEILQETDIEVLTMNGNTAKIFQILAKKRLIT